MKLLLGSKSPRRKELLSSLGYHFEIVDITCEEVFPKEISVDKIASFLSELKAKAFRKLEKNEVLITADTIVAINDKILGKPKNRQEAEEMLTILSGKQHQVYTGTTIKTFDNIFTIKDMAIVSISKITKEEINYYINNFQPMDKAGAYGIQEWLGIAKVSKIEGSFYTIMGLPTEKLYHLLINIENGLKH